MCSQNLHSPGVGLHVDMTANFSSYHLFFNICINYLA